MINTGPQLPKIVVYADRWDGFGGRICCIINAFSLARALDVEVGIIWPPKEEWGLENPLNFFESTLWDRYGITSDALLDRKRMNNPCNRTLSDARVLCDRVQGAQAIQMNLVFQVLRFRDETAEAAHERFLKCFHDIGWNSTIRTLIDTATRHKFDGKSTTIHLRAGDIMTGAWKQFVPLEKTLPYSFVNAAFHKIGAAKGARIALATDNPGYAARLKRQFDNVISPEMVFPDYAELKRGQQAMADVLMMAHAPRIFGPRQSAFSGLSARLQGTQVRSVSDLMEAGEAMALYRADLAQDPGDAHRSIQEREIFARDICWYLDVFSEALPLVEKFRMSARARAADPAFCGALTRHAIHAALMGKAAEAAWCAQQAREKAARVTVQPDPLVESLAVSVSVAMLAPAPPTGKFDRLLERVLGRPWQAAQIVPWEDEVSGYLDQIAALTPFQTARDQLLDAFHFQQAVMRALSTLRRSHGAKLRTAMRAFA